MSKNQKLLDILQTQRLDGNIDLQNMYIGDEGASILANFLRQNTHIRTLLLDGNKISSQGFAGIFASLSMNTAINEISVRFNCLGKGDTSGLAALYEFAKNCTSLTTLNLSNNYINGLDIEPIAHLISESPSLIHLDVTFNELGNQGGNILLDGLKNNKNLLSLDLAGNNISETICNEVDIQLRKNAKQSLEKNSINSNYTQTTQFHTTIKKNNIDMIGGAYGDRGLDNQALLTEKFTQGRREIKVVPSPGEGGMSVGGTFINNQITGSNKYGIAFSEKVLNDERRRGIETREVMAKQIEDLMSKDLKGATLIRELESKYYDSLEHIDNLKNENEKLREEYLKSRDENNLLELRYEERIKNLEFQSNERDKNEKLMMDKILTEHNVNVKELNRDWESRLEEIEKKNRDILNRKEDLEIELQRVLDSVDIIKQEHSLEVKELVEKIKDEEYNRYEEQLQSLNSRIRNLEEAREEHARRISDETKKSTHREQKLQENMIKIEAEANTKNSQNISLSSQVEELKQKVEELKSDIVAKDIKISNLDRENLELHQVLNNKKENHASELEQIIQEHKRDRISWDNLRDNQHKKIQELERLIRLNEVEIGRMKQDYQKLADILQTNVTKAIYQTFTVKD